jgi:hypothetical protein
MRAIVFCLALAAVVFAGRYVPFKGSLDGSTVPPTTPGLERIEVSGNATHLGRFTAVLESDLTKIVVIGFDPDAGLPIATVPGTIVFTAANGDQVEAEGDLTGLLNPVDGNFPSFTFDNTITGGTGRFAGASGSFSGSGGQTTVPGEDNDLITATFDGKISRVGGK